MRVLSIAMPFDSERELYFALGVLTAINVAQHRWHSLPSLYESGVRYRREDAKRCWAPVAGGCEDWLSVVELYRQGEGDCEDLCCARASDLITRGERARAIPVRTSKGWHIVVKRADGSIEDPSVVLGMPAGESYRREMAHVLGR